MGAASRIAWITLVIGGCAEPVGGLIATSGDAGAPSDQEDARAAATPDGPAVSIEEPPALGALAGTPTGEASATSPIGVWFLDADGARLTLRVTAGVGAARYRGTVFAESAPSAVSAVAELAWDDATGRLRFTADLGGTRRWFEADAVEGALLGRYATGAVTDDAPVAALYRGHVTGWNATLLDRELVPRTFEIRWADGRRGRLQVDRGDGGFVGTLKVYASERNGALDEGEQRDLTGVSWDGVTLAADVDDRGVAWHYAGVVSGRRIDGAATAGDGAAPVSFAGTRAEVLGHGMVARPAAAQAAWRARARRQLQHMIMGDDPRPTAAQVTVLGEGLAPIALRTVPPERDDDLERPQAYTLSELRFDYTLADPRGGAPITRRSHAWMATPTTPAPPGGYPVALALNGHWGSARQVMDPSSAYWYGDGYARQGYVVIAVDVSHRPYADRPGLYVDLTGGDAPGDGNGPHPAIASAGFDTDWSEDGERAWDAARALDHVLARPDVNPARVTVTGLSLGAEVATIAGALDPRVTNVVAAGFSPDLNVMAARAPHYCWQWQHADVREYVDTSDFHALIAPRTLVVETGLSDPTFSNFRAPYAADKQVLRRARAAYGGGAERLVHYLHPGGHSYRVGDPAEELGKARGVTIPTLIAPGALSPLAWQTDGAIVQRRATVFDLTLWFRGRVVP
ncbi:MAG: Acetyl xylan esterase [Myxococcaceae bacterium]|nr:Acetyl xylan esterase [Myxococcaceae bacterium]